MIDLRQVEELIKNIEQLKSTLDYVEQEDKFIINNLIEKYSNKIQEWEDFFQIVKNPSPSELGAVRSSIKKILVARFLNPIKDKIDPIEFDVLKYRLYSHIHYELKGFSKALVGSLLFFYRKTSWNKKTSVQHQALNLLKNQVEFEFIKNNKNIVESILTKNYHYEIYSEH